MSEEYENVRKTKDRFCPDCHNFLYPKKINEKVLYACRNCGEVYELEKGVSLNNIFTQYTKVKKNEIRIIEDDEIISASKIKFDCPKCGNNKAYMWLQKFGAADEPEHEFRRCTKCGYTEKSGWQI